MKKIAFLTFAEEPTLTSDDRLAIGPLASAGVSVHPWIWGDEKHDATDFDGIVFRSCWDYHLRGEEFRSWVEKLAGAGTPICNPSETIAWNLNKKYLLDLVKRDVTLPETRWHKKGSAITPTELALTRNPGSSIVIKPAISLNGFDTRRFSPGDLESAAEFATGIAVARDVLIQEYVEEIETEGEISLVYVGNRFSHAIRKTPRAGEFRVQVEHGGRRTPLAPSPEVTDCGMRILEASQMRWVYARVDGVIRNGEFTLMELELIDPMLFLAYHDKAPSRFAEAVFEWIDGGGR